jgi:DNA-binding FadR family transcriptional regulator
MVLQAQGTHLADVQTARAIIEPPAARMVAERSSSETISQLLLALNAEREQVDSSGFPFAAMRFHETLMQLSGNHTLSTFLFVLRDIHEGVAVALSQYPPDAGSGVRARTLAYHEALIDLIEAGDGAGAEKLWREYWQWITPLTHPEEAIVDVLKNLGDDND